MTPPNTELAACPFCGSSDIHFHTVRICITCNSCEAEGPMANTEDEAWNLWRKRHLATLREDKGGDFKPLFEDVRKGLSNQSTGGEVAIAWSSLKRIEISLDALKNPSDAGGAKAKLEITRALNDARRCTNNVVSQGPMGSVTFEQGCAARDYIDRALVILESSKPTPPQADTPIKGAGDLGFVKPIYTIELPAGEYVINGELQKLEHRVKIETAAQREDVSGEKPAVFYCENGKSLEGLEQGALAVLSNLMMKTNATNAEFMIGNEKDGEFYFTCSRTKPTPAPIDAEVREALADVELCMRDYAYDPLLGRKLRKHLTTIRAALKKGG